MSNNRPQLVQLGMSTENDRYPFIEMITMRKLPVAPIQRSGHLPLFGNWFDTDPKSEAFSHASGRAIEEGRTRPHGRCVRDAVDVSMPKTIGIDADGEVAWS